MSNDRSEEMNKTPPFFENRGDSNSTTSLDFEPRPCEEGEEDSTSSFEMVDKQPESKSSPSFFSNFWNYIPSFPYTSKPSRLEREAMEWDRALDNYLELIEKQNDDITFMQEALLRIEQDQKIASHILKDLIAKLNKKFYSSDSAKSQPDENDDSLSAQRDLNESQEVRLAEHAKAIQEALCNYPKLGHTRDLTADEISNITQERQAHHENIRLSFEQYLLNNFRHVKIIESEVENVESLGFTFGS